MNALRGDLSDQKLVYDRETGFGPKSRAEASKNFYTDFFRSITPPMPPMPQSSARIEDGSGTRS